MNKMQKITLFIISVFVTSISFTQVVPNSGNILLRSAEDQMSSEDNIISRSPKVELLADCFQFTEGPVSDTQGNIYFTDIPASRIYVWSVENKLKVIREPSGRANGLRFDASGNLLACEGASRRVTSTSPEGRITVLADRYQGKKLNSPNDLWVDQKGGIYFTDPRYSKGGWIWSEKYSYTDHVTDTIENKEEQPVRALYYLPPDGKPLRRVAEDFINPNGVVGTLDGKKLYVSDTEKKEVYVFDILSDGSLVNRKIFVSGYSDGMTLDEKNNLYLTNGGVHIYTPAGKLITTIDLPYRSSNVCFGGRDHKTLFITAGKGLFAVQMKVTGQ
jgi:gluconolactonase